MAVGSHTTETCFHCCDFVMLTVGVEAMFQQGNLKYEYEFGINWDDQRYLTYVGDSWMLDPIPVLAM